VITLFFSTFYPVKLYESCDSRRKREKPDNLFTGGGKKDTMATADNNNKRPILLPLPADVAAIKMHGDIIDPGKTPVSGKIRLLCCGSTRCHRKIRRIANAMALIAIVGAISLLFATFIYLFIGCRLQVAMHRDANRGTTEYMREHKDAAAAATSRNNNKTTTADAPQKKETDDDCMAYGISALLFTAIIVGFIAKRFFCHNRTSLGKYE